MKRVMRKIFVSVLALAMIVGIIGVQKNVSAAEAESYSHVDVQTSGVSFKVSTKRIGAEEAEEVVYDKIESIRVFVVTGETEKELQLLRQAGDEFGFVVDAKRVEYAGNVYAVKGPNKSWDGLRITDDFDAIKVVATLSNNDTAKIDDVVITIARNDIKNICKGSGDTLGIDFELKSSETMVEYKFVDGENVVDGVVEAGTDVAKFAPETDDNFIGWFVGEDKAESFVVDEPTTFEAKYEEPVVEDPYFYTHVDVQVKGELKVDEEIYDTVESVDSVTVVYEDDTRNLVLQPAKRESDEEFGWVVNKEKVTYKNSIYVCDDWTDNKIPRDYKGLIIEATMSNETGYYEFTFKLENDEKYENACKGKFEDTTKGLDVTLKAEIELPEAVIYVKHVYALKDTYTNTIEDFAKDGRFITGKKVGESYDFSEDLDSLLVLEYNGRTYKFFDCTPTEGMFEDLQAENELVIYYTAEYSSYVAPSNDDNNDYIPVTIIEEEKIVDIVEEEVPEAPAEVEEEEVEEVIEEIEVEVPEIPEALPKTGTAPVELFFGIGSFFMTLGAAFVLFGRRKQF